MQSVEIALSILNENTIRFLRNITSRPSRYVQKDKEHHTEPYPLSFVKQLQRSSVFVILPQKICLSDFL
jgi:hypothetical protein